MSTSNTGLMPRIESRIHVIRGSRVKRNRDRFPCDFLFQLTLDKKAEVVANCDYLQNLNFSKALPFAFSEHGARMIDTPCVSALAKRKLPHRVRKRSGDYNPGADAIQMMTMKVSKGLEFSVVALPGVGHMPAAEEDEKEAARVFYVVATRATQRLVMGVGGEGKFGWRLLE